jgi:hypothetical protein
MYIFNVKREGQKIHLLGVKISPCRSSKSIFEEIMDQHNPCRTNMGHLP